MKNRVNNRGFRVIEFVDLGNMKCNIQKSSLATDDAIWFGLEEPHAFYSIGGKIMEFVKPDDLFISSRMHLTREQVKEILPVLQVFADTGELPNLEELEVDDND